MYSVLSYRIRQAVGQVHNARQNGSAREEFVFFKCLRADVMADLAPSPSPVTVVQRKIATTLLMKETRKHEAIRDSRINFLRVVIFSGFRCFRRGAIIDKMAHF